MRHGRHSDQCVSKRVAALSAARAPLFGEAWMPRGNAPDGTPIICIEAK
jgi:hypothetical protein